MADRVLCIAWGQVRPGREERSLEVFNDALGLSGRMQQDGRIEKFDVVVLAPNSELNGYIELHGTAEQIAAVKEDEEFLRNTADAMLVVEKLRHIDGVVNEGVARQIEIFQEAIGKVPQSA